MSIFIKTSLAVALAVGFAGISAPVLAEQDGLDLTIKNQSRLDIWVGDMDHVKKSPSTIAAGDSGVVETDWHDATIEYTIENAGGGAEQCTATAKVSYVYAGADCKSKSYTFSSTNDHCAFTENSCGSDSCNCSLNFTSPW